MTKQGFLQGEPHNLLLLTSTEAKAKMYSPNADTIGRAYAPVERASVNEEEVHRSEKAPTRMVHNQAHNFSQEDCMIMEFDLGSSFFMSLDNKSQGCAMTYAKQQNDSEEQGNTQATAMSSYRSHAPNWDASLSSVGSRGMESTESRSMMYWHRNPSVHQPMIPQMQVQIIDDGLPTQHGTEESDHTQLHPSSFQSHHPHFDIAWTRNPRSFDDSYTISNNGQPIGEGGYGVVYSCVSKEERKRRAVKVIAAEKYDHEEIEILQSLSDGPNIVTLQDIHFGFDRVYLVMEEMKGDLLTRLSDKVYYNEAEARTVIHTIMDAVRFLHRRGVCHRDIKPENVLVGVEDTDVKLADFGLAKRFRDANGNRLDPNMFTMCGSVWYAAPEVFGRPSSQVDCLPYDERCDVWSVGILMYLLLAGYMPFMTEDNNNDYKVVQEVKRGRYKFHGEYWGNISLAAKQLITSLLKVHPVQRCTIQEALDSPWIVLPITAHFLGQNILLV